ncbi:MAG TPA: DNA polymerase/3'-5' exonuclease PolX [Urbifossiella sp.]|nr:DNA polymerase/3'-5' exonuclease PolX [Urbifossiella sp.]
MSKDEVADALDEIGVLLELQGENAFRCNAYFNGARTVRSLSDDLKRLVAEKRLGEVRGLGAALADKITTLVTTGELPYLTDLRRQVPAGLIEMRQLQGVGSKKVKALHDALGVDTVDKLKAACEAGDVAKLKGFGAKTQANILEAIRFREEAGQRVRIDMASGLAEALVARVRELPGVVRAEACGSVRRRRETCGDLDILASAADAQPVIDAFAAFPEVVRVLGQGPTKVSVLATSRVDGDKVTLQADLRVLTDDLFPFGLHYFTGSKAHNIRMRQRALDRGWLLSEYGLGTADAPVHCTTEADIFAALDLEYVPPELREDTGEMEAAEAKALPRLLEYGDLRGVFHNHTTYSDGSASLEEMALAAKALGWEYFGVGDHSQSLAVARGMPPSVVRKQWDEIDAVNARLTGVRILKGIESDILQDGSLDYPDELLAGFDYVVGSVHTHFGMTEAEQTERVCRALAHPALTMLGHATGRLLLKREGYKIDLEEVLKTAARFGKMVEINANPYRLDLDWVHAKRAKALGVQLVINPDAHSPGQLGLTRYGVDVARRGWLEAKDVFNTRSLAEVQAELARRKRA